MVLSNSYLAKIVLISVVLAAGTTVPQAHARYSNWNYGSNGSSSSPNHILTVGGGISSPSETPRTAENPAGLVFNQGSKISASLDSGVGNAANVLGNSFQFFTGNKLAGASLGVQTFNNVSDERGSMSYLNFGLAALAEPIHLAFGLNGSYRFQKAGSVPGPDAANTWTATFGMIFNPHGAVRVGTNFFGVSEGLKAVGAGVSVDVNSFSTLALDVSTNHLTRGFTIKPALGIVATPFMITYGYGIHVGEAAPEYGISSGNTLGVGFQFSPGFRMEGAYNTTSQFHLGATISF